MRHPSPPIVVAAVVTLAALLASACTTRSGADDDAAVAPSVSRTIPVTATTEPADADPLGTDDRGDPAEGTDGFACQTGERSSAGDIVRPELIEASGLAASGRTAGVLWSHNDSGAGAGVFAIDTAGHDLGYVALVRDGAPLPAIDIEDIAVADGTIYLADIGDNAAVRPSVTVHLIDEPSIDLAARGPADTTVEVGRSIEIRYEGGPTDAEALLVDATTGDLLLFSKDLDAPRAPTTLSLVPGAVVAEAAGGDDAVTAAEIGALDVAAMTESSSGLSVGALLFPGAVTGADMTPAGDLIALRTYGSVWLFDREPGQTLIEALGGVPCEVRVAGETQGESVAFLSPEADDQAGTIRLATLGEGANQPVNLTVVQISR